MRGGIYSKTSKSVYSIILSGGNYYSDVNKGDTIWYSSINNKNKTLTKNIRYIFNLITCAIYGRCRVI